jgi:WD40 repeat protein
VGAPLARLEGPTSPTGNIDFPAFSPDGTRLAAVKPDNTVVVWDLLTGQETLQLSGHTNRVFGLTFSPDGTRLATIAYDKTARLWDATSGEIVYTLDVFTETLNVGGQWIDLDFNHDGSKLATAGGTSVKVWDTANGQELLTLSQQEITAPAYAYSVAFSPDGASLAIGLRLGAGAGVWDATTGQKILHLSGHTGSVTDITYSPDERQIATSSVDGTVRLWNATTGVAQLTLKGYATQVAQVAYSPDGTRLMTQGADRTIRIYAVRPEDLVAMALSRLTRWWRPEECVQYLHMEECPMRP